MDWFVDIRDRRPRLSFCSTHVSAHQGNRSNHTMKKKKKAKKIFYSTADCDAVPNETAAMGKPLRGPSKYQLLDKKNSRNKSQKTKGTEKARGHQRGGSTAGAQLQFGNDMDSLTTQSEGLSFSCLIFCYCLFQSKETFKIIPFSSFMAVLIRLSLLPSILHSFIDRMEWHHHPSIPSLLP
jgi:hypothetical protein